MSRRRSIKFLSALAAASLIVAACGDDDDDAVSGDTSATSAEGTEPEGTTGDTGGTEPDGTTGDTAGTEPEGSEPPGSLPPGAENVGVEGGSGCGIPHGPYEDPGEPAGEVRVAWNDPLLSFNTESIRGNATQNANPLYLMGLGSGGGFWYYDQDLNLINNDQFGTCTVDSLDPLTVTYRINEGVTWSDGTQIDAADLILNWASQSGVYNDATSVITDTGVTAEADPDGNPVVLNPQGQEVPYAEVPFDAETGALPEGWTYKESAGIQFDSSDPSLSHITQFPEISEDGLAVTITWDEYYVDYQTGGLAVNPPAHTTARIALGVEDPAEAKQALIDAFQNEDTAAIKSISEVYNTDYDATALPDDPGLYLSAGPYVLESYEELTEMVFQINPDYDWGPKPKVATIVYRVIGDPTAAAQALENEEIDVIQPQSTADLLQQVEGLADRGIESVTGDEGTYEHLDLAMDNGGPFDPAAYGGDEEKARMVRQAFLKTIPRQEILDRLIVPLNPDAELRDSFTTVPGAPTYDAIAENNGSSEYAEVDIEGAQALLEQAGVTTPVDVRFLFADDNPRRANEYDLIAASAREAGFNVIDGRSPTWGPDLSDTSVYDASLFGWQSVAVDVASSEELYATGTGSSSNYGGYSSQVVDDLFAQLRGSTDAAEQQELLLEIEQNLWADAFGVTIFQFPVLTAWNSTYVSNVSSIPLSPTVFWNFWEWEAP